MNRTLRSSGISLTLAIAAAAATLGLNFLAPVSTQTGTVVAAQSRGRTPARRAQTVQRATPYDKGYLKGYNDGFAQGRIDWENGKPRDYQQSEAFQNREDTFDPAVGFYESYRQGHQLGFELGYTDGYYGRVKNAVVPANGAVLARAAALADAERERQRERELAERGRSRPRSAVSINVPANTEFRIRLTSPIDTKANRVGDRFTAEVLTPAAYEGAKVDGHVASINKSGRVTGRTELALTFDTITLPDGRQGKLNAELQRVIESETVKKTDEEGNVESGSRSKDSQVRGGVGAAAGAVIGGIAGGAKGAILGAILGGAAGVGTVYVEGSKDLLLDVGTEMIIKTVRTSSERER